MKKEKGTYFFKDDGWKEGQIVVCESSKSLASTVYHVGMQYTLFSRSTSDDMLFARGAIGNVTVNGFSAQFSTLEDEQWSKWESVESSYKHSCFIDGASFQMRKTVEYNDVGCPLTTNLEYRIDVLTPPKKKDVVKTFGFAFFGVNYEVDVGQDNTPNWSTVKQT